MQFRLSSLKSAKVFRNARYISAIDKGIFLFKFVNIPEEEVQVGIIVTKKMGNAVVRNFIRRRIKNALNESVKDFIPPSHTAIIVIGKRDSKKAPFAKMVDAFTSILINHTRHLLVK